MAAATINTFTNWLLRKLREIEADETVFGKYIQSILESDISPQEKSNEIREILSEIMEDDQPINELCSEIEVKWYSVQQEESLPSESTSEQVNDKLVKLLESQALATTKQKKYTEDEKRIREAILSQYSQMTDDEDETETVNQSGNHKVDFEKNTNVQAVLQAEKVKREQARLDSQKKKEKDKEDREKQKQQKEEKKEKRKTQKGERRR